MRRALVTGAASGIGRAVARALLADGWDVISITRGEVAAREDDPQTWRVRSWRWSWDISKPPYQDDLDAYRAYPADALIHCAAQYGPIGPFETIDIRAWSKAINVNLIGTARVVQVALPALRQSDDPRILLFAGGGAFNARPRFSAYAASKSGVVSLVETLAEELAPAITVNGVSPGFVGTPIHQATLAAGPDLATASEYAQAKLAETYEPFAMERAIACVRHLLSPATRGLTGKCISAEHDSWASVTPADVESLNDSPLWTRTRLGKKAGAMEHA